jgi:DNA recombination protein RmuC
MELVLFGIILVALIIVVVLLVWMARRSGSNDAVPGAFADLSNAQARYDQNIRDEFGRIRTENASIAREQRQEIDSSIQALTDSILKRMTEFGQLQTQRLDGFSVQSTGIAESIDHKLDSSRQTIDELLRAVVKESRDSHATFRTEITGAFDTLSTRLDGRLLEAISTQSTQLETTSSNVAQALNGSSRMTVEELERLRLAVEAKLVVIQNDGSAKLENIRNNVEGKLADVTTAVTQAIDTLSRRTVEGAETLKHTVETKLSSIQSDNSLKLEQIRVTVDEKLHSTLEQRLGESFKLVSERLELVHAGLGEMRTLASGVGDLKKVLTNIKARGNWGEVQLGSLLEQMLTPDQYSKNVQTNPDSGGRVEYAVKLPGREAGTPVWLPIDSKFPHQDYERLIEASELGDSAAVSAHAAALEENICAEAKKIREKYICPPQTVDFAILFLPTEGLFAEVLRRPGICDRTLNDRVVLAGPTTLAALLSSLQMGFRTLAIEKRSGEVWSVLGSVKSEFAKFGESLQAVEKKLHEASNKLGDVQTRSRVLNRKLRNVQELPVGESPDTLKVGSLLIAANAEEETSRVGNPHDEQYEDPDESNSQL